MIKINLLPVKEAKKRTTIQNQFVVAVIVILVVVVGVIYVAILRKSTISDLNTQVAQKQKNLTALQETQKKVEQFKKDNENLSQKIEVIGGLEAGRDWYLQIIDQISQAIPKEVWINTLRVPSGKNVAGAEWEIQGSALEKDQLSNFMSNLEKNSNYFGTPSLKNVTRQGGTGASGAGNSYYKYSIGVPIKSPPKLEPGAG